MNNLPPESFNPIHVRHLQKTCKAFPITKSQKTSKDERICKANNAIESNQLEKALEILNDVLVSANDEENSKIEQHEVLVQRAGIQMEMRSFEKAREDAQTAILLKPDYIKAYLRLSSVELELKQFGRAEVVLKLGLKVDADDCLLKSKLKSLEDQDSVLAPVRALNGSDVPARNSQRKAGLDFGMYNFYSKPSVICFIMHGDVSNLKKVWRSNMVGFKHGLINNPLIHFPILGIQRLDPHDPSLGVSRVKDYVEVIEFLFGQGVRLDARDQVGFTAVMHAAGHHPQPELLEHLLKKGADPDVRSVYGSVALTDATSNQNEREIDLLLTYGANAHIKCNDDMSPYEFAERFKRLIAIYHKHLLPPLPEKVCSVCRSPMGINRCFGCRVVYYCGVDCQKSDWRNHKVNCKKHRKSHKRLAILNSSKEYWNNNPHHTAVHITNLREMSWHNILNGETPGYKRKEVEIIEYNANGIENLFDVYTAEWQKKGNMILKIQFGEVWTYPGTTKEKYIEAREKGKPLKDENGNWIMPRLTVLPNEPISAYNEDRNFQCFLEPRALDADDVLAVVEEKGIISKAYFWAFMEKGRNEIVIITDPVLPAQAW